MTIIRIARVSMLCVSVVGCSAKPQSLHFEISGNEPLNSYSFFPVVEVNEKLVLGNATAKIADASGYQNWEISATYPQNLATPWRTSRLARYKRIGIVIIKRNELNEPLLDAARVYWCDSKTVGSSEETVQVEIPAFDSLPTIEIESHWQ